MGICLDPNKHGRCQRLRCCMMIMLIRLFPFALVLFTSQLVFFSFIIYTQCQKVRKWGSDFWLSIKSVSNILSCCCFVCAFIIGQYHSGNNMSSKSGAAGEILFWESEKHHEIWPLKTDTLMVSAFDAFIYIHYESKHYLSYQFAQRRYHFTLHIKSIIPKFSFWS